MSKVSSLFTVTAINDGVTVSATMTTSSSLAQQFTGATCVPNWAEGSGGPELTVTAYKNGSAASVASGTWYWNGVAITTNNATVMPAYANLFRASLSSGIPKLKIIGNLASAENTDDDVISYQGQVMLSSSSVSFEVSRSVRLSRAESSGYVGVLEFVTGRDLADATTENAPTILNEETDTVYIRATLFSGGGAGATSGFTPKWFIGDTEKSGGNPLTVTRDMVDDYATVRCIFLDNNGEEELTTAYITVDDDLDAFQMFTSSVLLAADGNVSGSAQSPTPEGNMQVREGQSVRLLAWIGDNHDPDSTAHANWSFSAKVYNAGGSEYTGTIGGKSYSSQLRAYEINNSTNKYNSLNALKNAVQHGEFDISYDDVSNEKMGKQCSIMIIAQSENE